jgi:hypothetical protein
MLSLPNALLEHVAAFVPCRATRATTGYSYDLCITLGIPPCPLALQPFFKAHLERLLPLRQTAWGLHGWGLHFYNPPTQTSVWLCYDADDDSERLLMTVTTCIGFDGPGRLKQALCGEVRDLHVMSGDVDAPGSWSVHRSTRQASYAVLYGPEWCSAPWFNPGASSNWFVRLEDTGEVMPLEAYCRAINQV